MRVLVLVVLAAAATGCSGGQGCDGLDALTTQRDAARVEWQQAVQAQHAGRTTQADADAAHDRMHGLDRRAYDLAQSCGEGWATGRAAPSIGACR